MARKLLGGSYNILHSIHGDWASNRRIYLGSVCLFVSKKSQRPHLTVEFKSAISILLFPRPQQDWLLPPQWLWTSKQPQPGQPHFPATSFHGTRKFLSQKIKFQGFDFPSISAKSTTSRGDWQSAGDSPFLQYLSHHQHCPQPEPAGLPLVQQQPSPFATAATCLWVHHKVVPRFLSRVLSFSIGFFLVFYWKDIISRRNRISRTWPKWLKSLQAGNTHASWTLQCKTHFLQSHFSLSHEEVMFSQIVIYLCILYSM